MNEGWKIIFVGVCLLIIWMVAKEIWSRRRR